MSTVDQDYDDEDRTYINDPAFWKMIDERRKEVGIPWGEAEKLLGLDDHVPGHAHSADGEA